MNTPDRNSKQANNRTVLVLDGDVLARMAKSHGFGSPRRGA